MINFDKYIINKSDNANNEYNYNENLYEDFNIINSLNLAAKKVENDVKSTSKKVETVLKKGGKEIVSIGNDITKSLSLSMGLVLKPIEKIFKKLPVNNLIAFFITLVIPFFGQILARLIFLNVSFDKLWLLFFGLPPFTLFPAILIALNLIKKGKGIEWDHYILIPIFLNIFSGFILKLFYNQEIIFFVKFCLVLLSFMYIYWIKSKKICKSKSAPITKIISDSLLTSILIGIVSSILRLIPMINIVISIIENNIPHGNLITESISIFMIYLVLGIINKLSKKFCKEDSTISYIIQLTIICALIIYKKRLDNL